MRSVDFENNAILGEYNDVDTLRQQLVWFTANSVYPLIVPIDKRYGNENLSTLV